MVPCFTLLSCESPVSVKENPDRIKKDLLSGNILIISSPDSSFLLKEKIQMLSDAFFF